MTGHSRTNGYIGPAPLAPWPVHAAELEAYDVGELLAGMRARYLHLSDASRWDDEARSIASTMASGVKLCLEDLESAIRRAAR